VEKKHMKVCPTCELAPKADDHHIGFQHSLRQGGICDFLKARGISNASHPDVVKLLLRGERIQL
jgi:hypothetical protein